MSSSGGVEGSRVSIPADQLKTIQNIREITGTHHSDDDIFSVFKDCSNDPHETAQKLLYLDTFQEVKSKRERKKEKLVPATQGRGRNGRRNFASNYTDASNGRSAGFKRQSKANHMKGGSRTALPAPNKSINDTKQDHPASNCGSQSDQVTRSEAAADKGNNQSLLKSDAGERPHVIFSAHIQGAKMLENGLRFGCFDSDFVKEEASSDNCTIGCHVSNIKSSHGTSAYGRQLGWKDVLTSSQDKDHEISNSAPETKLALQSDQTIHLVEGSEVDKLKEDDLSVKDTHQATNFDAPPVSYPDQCSYQQAMHLFRQQYPLNVFPYGPYFPPCYMLQPHQFLSPNGSQQQSYLPPGDGAPPGDKLLLPHIKSGSDIGISPRTTVPSPSDSYAAAFNHIPSAATVSSTHKEVEKEDNIYTTGPLSLANLQARALYNLSLQGQPLAFSTMQAGFTERYQQTQPILAAPTISAMTEQPIGPPHITNQQPQAALTNLDNNY